MTELDPIEIPVVLSGISEVKSALKSLKDELVKLERSSAKATEESSKKRIKSYHDEMNELKKLQDQASRKVDSDLGNTFGAGSPRGGGKRAKARGGSADNGFMDLTGLDKVAGNVKKFASGVGIAAAGFLALKAGVEVAAEALTQFGSFVLSDVVKPALALETFATQVENASGGQVKAQEIMDKSRALQLKYNVDAQKAAEAMASFADKTGNFKVGTEALDMISSIQKGYGGDLNQMVDMAAALFNKSKELDPNTSTADLQQLLLAQLGQGQVEGGKFTFKELANLGGELTRGAGNLSGSASKRLTETSALLQAGGITGKADVSMTAVNAFLLEAPKMIKKMGGSKQVNKQGQLVDLGEALEFTLKKSGGNLQKLREKGFTDTSLSLLSQFMPRYQQALKGGKKPEEAAKEALEVFNRIKEATAKEADVKEAASKTMQTTGEKWDTAMNQVKIQLLDIMPEISKFVDEFTQNIPQIADAAKTVAEALVAFAQLVLKLIPEDLDKRLNKVQVTKEDINTSFDEKQELKPELMEKAVKITAAKSDSTIHRGMVGFSDAIGLARLASNLGLNKHLATDEEKAEYMQLEQQLYKEQRNAEAAAEAEAIAKAAEANAKMAESAKAAADSITKLAESIKDVNRSKPLSDR